MQIDGWTLALQAVNFLVLVWLLQHFLYRPVLGIIDARQQQVDAVLAEADAAKADAQQLQAELEGQRTGIAREREQVLEEAHARAEKEAAGLLGRARDEAEKLIEEQHRRVAQERAEAAEALRQQTIELGIGIARRLLFEASSAGLDRPFLERGLARLQELGEGAGRQLLGRSAGTVAVVTATPLDAAAKDEFGERLRALLGADVEVRFGHDPALLAGVELHFPHTVLHHSWQQGVREIEDELRQHGRLAGRA